MPSIDWQWPDLLHSDFGSALDYGLIMCSDAGHLKPKLVLSAESVVVQHVRVVRMSFDKIVTADPRHRVTVGLWICPSHSTNRWKVTREKASWISPQLTNQKPWVLPVFLLLFSHDRCQMLNLTRIWEVPERLDRPCLVSNKTSTVPY